MTLSSTAAAAAPKGPSDSSDTSLSRYITRVEFPVKESLSNAPLLLQRLLAALVAKIPGIIFYSAGDDKIDIEDFPSAKAEFDQFFSTIVTESRNQRLVVGFEIRSVQSFHTIKTSVWSFLKTHDIFLKKHSGSLAKMDIVSIGYIHRAHPTFTSHDNLREEIFAAIHAKIQDMPPAELEQLRIAPDTPIPDLFLSTGRINGTFANGKIQSNVLYVQAERIHADLLRPIIEKCFSDKIMTFIPNSLRREDPELFGKFLCHQNDFLEHHRNIAVVALSPEAMDHEEHPDMSPPDVPNPPGENLWNSLRFIPGVRRIDSCRRTPDLGKWNISTTKENYPSVTAWIDTNLPTLFAALPMEIQVNSVNDEFDTPRRLTRTTRSYTPRGSTPSAYNSSLASRLGSPSADTVQRSAWRPHQPVVDISYAFNDNEFPPMAKKLHSETKSTASTSYVSSISEQALKSAIAAESDKLKAANDARSSAIDARIQSIETSLQTLAQTLVQEIFLKLSGVDSPFVTATQLDSKLDKLSRQIEQLAQAATATPAIKSPPRKQRRSDQDDKAEMAIDHEPPDKKYE